MTEPLRSPIARWVNDTLSHGTSDPVREDAARRLQDLVGVSLAATTQPGVSRIAASVPDPPHRAASTILGRPTTLEGAAFANGVLAHALDYDDTHFPSVIHPTAAVGSALLAFASVVPLTAPTALNALAIGRELSVRLAMAGYDRESRTSSYLARGFHATSLCGGVASAAVVAALRGMGDTGIAESMSVAASLASGILETNRSGGTVKWIHCGWAARVGVVAADLVGAGLTGPSTAIEGPFGFLSAFAGTSAEAALIIEGLGDEWLSRQSYFKPYPVNHFLHPLVDAALELRRKGVDPIGIARVEIGLPAQVIEVVGRPVAVKINPQSPYQARFSAPFVTAAALLGGDGLGLYLTDFTTDSIADQTRLGLAEKTVCVPDAEATAAFPDAITGVVRVIHVDGSSDEHRTLHTLGGPDHPLSTNQLATKFRLNASQALSPTEVSRLDSAFQELSRSSGYLAEILATTYSIDS